MTRPIWMLMMREASRVNPVVRGIIARGVTRGIVGRGRHTWVGVRLVDELIYTYLIQRTLLTLKLIACWWEVVFRVIESPDVFNKLLSNAWLTGSVVVPVKCGAFDVVECNKCDFSSDTESDVSKWRFRSRNDRWSGRSISSVINVKGDPGWNASIWVGLVRSCSHHSLIKREREHHPFLVPSVCVDMSDDFFRLLPSSFVWFALSGRWLSSVDEGNLWISNRCVFVVGEPVLLVLWDSLFEWVNIW